MTQTRNRIILTVLAVFGLCDAALAQDKYPSRPITVVVPFAAGGPLDVSTRVLGVALTNTLGQPIIIENASGAGGSIGAGRVARSTPDGYTLLMYHIGTATTPALYRGKLSYDPIKDLTPVALVNDGPMAFVAKPNAPPTNLKEFLAYARSQGSKFNLGHAGIGAASHLCSVLFQKEIGTQVTTIPYRGTGPAMAALLSGEIDAICDVASNATGQIRAGALKAYAVTGTQRLPAIPDTPTVAEAGVPTLAMTNWNAMFAPKNTPAPIVERLVAALGVALKDPTVVQRFAELGTMPIDATPKAAEVLKAHLAAETARWTPIIEQSGQFAE